MCSFSSKRNACLSHKAGGGVQWLDFSNDEQELKCSLRIHPLSYKSVHLLLVTTAASETLGDLCSHQLHITHLVLLYTKSYGLVYLQKYILR